jgi:hypothetical protein
MAAAAMTAGLVLMTPLSVAAAAQPPRSETIRHMMASNAATDLRVNLNLLTQEHVYLAGAATGAAIGGREAEFKSAAAELDENTVALSKMIGSVYGADAEQAFLGLWRAHIGFFADYAMGAATKDQAKQQKARADLDGYRNDIDAFLTGANPNLPKGAVAELFRAHVDHLTMAIDAQAAGDATKAYDTLHMAAGQSHMIADPLAAAIIAQFPEKFDAMATVPSMGTPSMATHGPMTSSEIIDEEQHVNASNDTNDGSDQEDDTPTNR